MHIVVATARHQNRFFAVKNDHLCSRINTPQTFDTCLHLECTRLECEPNLWVFFEPLRYIVGIVERVFRNGAKVHPLWYLVFTKMRPLVRVFFVFNENGAFFFVPQHVVNVALFFAIYMHKARVDAFFTERADHFTAFLVASNLCFKGSVQP